ncbi:MAG: pyridoxal phosphate-dependent aminotransferase [Patescibacteria group bacterium]|nr:pyridoxal phosphate-dependent aminotransferase [Patescibacteria group bacterium]MDE1945982.1 pyridoxal phosphate-dependent aminotransferase [Patescibacteria group bacterium]
MRTNIVYEGADELTYEIREIVEVGHNIRATGVDIVWENIGDPVAKGEKIPSWIKDIVAEMVKDDASYAYSPTRGLLETREYIAKERNLEGGIRITPDDILFFNGLGDAIGKVYTYLNSRARVIGPNPAYSTHSSAEAAHASSHHITYRLDPKNKWYPDLADMRRKIEANPDIAGILIVNPDNPTGMVYPEKILKEIVVLAREFNLFIISDEIYSNLFYGVEHKKLASVIGDVPGIAMRGISKEFPWPGSRCGWVEFYNRDKDADFARYAKTLLDAKMLEVCSATLPQKVLPRVMGDPRYYPYLAARNAAYRKKADIACTIFSQVPGLIVNKPNGAFYLTVVFKEGVLDGTESLKAANPEAAKIIEPLMKTDKLDKRFVYSLLASAGICVVPLSSGFNSDLFGFRMTLLEPDEAKFRSIVERIAAAIREYVK